MTKTGLVGERLDPELRCDRTRGLGNALPKKTPLIATCRGGRQKKASEGDRTLDRRVGNAGDQDSKSEISKDVASSPSAACTTACTNDAENTGELAQTPPIADVLTKPSAGVEAIAALLSGLSPAERAQLVAALLDKERGDKR